MIRSWLSGLGLSALTLSAPMSPHNHVLCSGFVPKNDLQIPISAHQVGGVTKADYDAVLDAIEKHYAPIAQSQGGYLQLNRLWNDGSVNASAERRGRTWVLNMYGGLARHPIMTKDGFLMVACHEMGHHIGGAPKIAGWFGSDWASNEGAADYFATLRCMRELMPDQENERFVRENAIDPVVRRRCEELFNTQAEENLCMREGTAGMIGGLMFQTLRNEPTAPKFDTPDSSVVNRTYDDHPATQCRLDTYFQGALCVHDRNVDLSDSNPNQGTCSEANGQREGLRPRCWFKP
ncbi:MAG: hypothetical protein HC883_06545 [Bdellovibrionaceae bacterium]|nr:hypothetical protein [Pseudobdellovibrionaceae bacterium]